MAVTRVDKREIVEVSFRLPGGLILPHPTLVVSKDELQEVEDGLFYGLLISTKQIHSEYAIRIEPEWLNKPMRKQSYFITHLLYPFQTCEVLRQNNTFLKRRYFNLVIDRVIDNIFEYEKE